MYRVKRTIANGPIARIPTVTCRVRVYKNKCINNKTEFGFSNALCGKLVNVWGELSTVVNVTLRVCFDIIIQYSLYYAGHKLKNIFPFSRMEQLRPQAKFFQHQVLSMHLHSAKKCL
jgi:hypothetical protein